MNRPPSTTVNCALAKPQVERLRFFMKSGYGRGIESNVVDGPISWRALPTDPPGTEENGSF